MKLSTLILECLDFVFEPRCYACNEILIRPADVLGPRKCFCDICAAALSPLESPVCSCCAEPFLAAATDHLCGTCLSQAPPFSRIIAPFEYGGPLADAIARFKYTPSPYMASTLATLLPDVGKRAADWIIPVPLHPKRLCHRGFNQAALLAKGYARRQNVPFATGLLQRVGGENAQVGKSKKERIQNMKNAFKVIDRKGRLAGKRVILVDDVVTTTATVRAAASAIVKEGNASTVMVICLGRATMYRK